MERAIRLGPHRFSFEAEPHRISSSQQEALRTRTWRGERGLEVSSYVRHPVLRGLRSGGFIEKDSLALTAVGMAVRAELLIEANR